MGLMGTHGVMMRFGGAKVTYTVQGQPRLQLLQSSVDWPQARHGQTVETWLNF
jgi:hypothetical protein